MKKYLLLFALLPLFTFAQTVYNNAVDGAIYFKIKNSEHISLPFYDADIDKPEILSDYPEIKALTDIYNIKKIFKPFKTQTEDIQNIYKLIFSDYSNVDKIILQLQAIRYIQYAERKPIYQLFAMPDDVDTNQYYLTNINAFPAWDIITGDANVKVAIIDDASRITHEDLAANVWHNPGETLDGTDTDGNGYVDDINGWDAADVDNDPNPPVDLGIWGEIAFTHGTHCAGLVAAVTNNSVGIACASHNISYIPVKTVTDASFFPFGIEAAEEGFDYALVAEADVISMSFGGEDSTNFSTLNTLIQTAYNMDIICVAAAGNNGDGSGLGTPNAINYPANFPHVISVGATDSVDSKSAFSQYGTWIDVMAPGVSIYSTLAHSVPYGRQDGTSMACPIVAGICGLMLSYYPNATPDEIELCLKNGCDNIDAAPGNSAFIGQMGAGRVNVYNSLICLTDIKENQKNNFTNEIIVYPNPTTGKIKVEANGVERIEVFDITGKNLQGFENLESLNIDISNQPKGIYFIKVITNVGVAVKKVVLQ